MPTLHTSTTAQWAQPVGGHTGWRDDSRCWAWWWGCPMLQGATTGGQRPGSKWRSAHSFHRSTHTHTSPAMHIRGWSTNGVSTPVLPVIS